MTKKAISKNLWPLKTIDGSYSVAISVDGLLYCSLPVNLMLKGKFLVYLGANTLTLV